MIFTNFLFTSIFSFFNLFAMSIFIACLIAIAMANAHRAPTCIHQRPYAPFWITPPSHHHHHHQSHHVHRHTSEPIHVHDHRGHGEFTNIHVHGR